MLPGPLAPLEPHKTRALTTIYAPRKLKTRKNKTAQSRMLNEPLQPIQSPFNPLPAIGQKKRPDDTIIVFDIKKESPLAKRPDKLQDILNPLKTRGHRGNMPDVKPQPLLRENTYDVIRPIFLKAPKVKKRTPPDLSDVGTISPKSRFKKAAMRVAKLSSLPETGKLLCLRERETLKLRSEDEDSYKLEDLAESPTQQLDKLSEIFQCLEMKGRPRGKVKKENSWF